MSTTNEVSDQPTTKLAPPTTQVRRAMLSVFDKTGVVEFATALHELGWELVSSGGTAKAIGDAGIPVTDVAELTGFPAILGHRVVTLHPKVHGGLLADRSDPLHIADMEEYGIEGIDLLVANLYPFSSNPSIELIDVGGPAMVRAAAKNHAFVAVVTKPSEYYDILDELRTNGSISLATRRRLALAAFKVTARYDAEIVDWLMQQDNKATTGDAPICMQCGIQMLPTGSCWACPACGNTSGCS